MKMRLAEIRKERGMRQTDLADRMGVAKTTVSSWETGHRTPGGNDLLALARTLGVTVEELFEKPDSKGA